MIGDKNKDKLHSTVKSFLAAKDVEIQELKLQNQKLVMELENINHRHHLLKAKDQEIHELKLQIQNLIYQKDLEIQELKLQNQKLDKERDQEIQELKLQNKSGNF